MDRTGAMGVSTMRFTVILLLVVCSFASHAWGRQSPFAAASAMPSDVKLFIHVKNAVAVRKELADRPIANWFKSGLDTAKLENACAELERATALSRSQLFDLFLGREFTLVQRHEGEWALVTRVSSERFEGVLKRLRPRVGGPMHSMTVVELPEQEVVIACDKHQMIIAPSAKPALMHEIIARLSGDAKAAGPSLQSRIDSTGAPSLGAGNIAVYLHHDPPLGGASCLIANVQGSNVNIQHAAKFENAPFTHQVTKLTCDFTPVQAFENHALVTYMQPQDIGDGPVESFIVANLGHGLVSDSMRENLGDRRLVVVGEQDLRLAKQPIDLLTPTVVTCFEIKDRQPAVEQLDFQMERLTKAINNLCKGSMLTELPNCKAMCPDQIRQVDLTQASETFTGGFPVMKNVSLCWKVADGPKASWYVIGTHPGSLADVVKTLETRDSDEPPVAEQLESCGIGNGVRISRQLRSWSDEAEVLAEVENVPAFRASVAALADLAGGIRHCSWKLARPSAREMRLTVQIQLAEPDETRAE